MRDQQLGRCAQQRNRAIVRAGQAQSQVVARLAVKQSDQPDLHIKHAEELLEQIGGEKFGAADQLVRMDHAANRQTARAGAPFVASGEQLQVGCPRDRADPGGGDKAPAARIEPFPHQHRHIPARRAKPADQIGQRGIPMRR